MIYRHKQAKMRCISPVFGLSGYLGAHFLDVEGNGEEGKVHGDLVFAEVSEAAVCHVELHLPEDRFRLYTSSPPVSESFFGCEQLPGFAFVFVQSVVYLDCASVAFGLITETSQRTAFAVPGAVTCVLTSVATCRF